MLSRQAKEQSQEAPAKFIEHEIRTFANTNPTSRIPLIKDYIIFDEPLVKFADSDDPIFAEYKTIIAPTHLTPREALAKAYDKNLKDMAARLSVVSWILLINC